LRFTRPEKTQRDGDVLLDAMRKQTTTDGQGLVKAPAAALALGVSTSTLYRLARRGAIPCYWITPDVVRFDVNEILRASRGNARRVEAARA
jgi:predicted DNA-binding transcriptional regulator AlpA